MTTDHALVLRLTAPMQSWGVRGGFPDYRDTLTHPTRSGVLGFLACALGHPRGTGPGNLADLDLTVRVDRPGEHMDDFHTIGGQSNDEDEVVPSADGKCREGAVLTRRAYLADAAFTIALTGPPPLLHTLENALDHPVYMPYLGRRACPPAAPYNLGIHTGTVTQILGTTPMDRTRPIKGDTVTADVITTVTHQDIGATHTLNDDPHGIRQFAQRTVKTRPVSYPADLCMDRGATAADRYHRLHQYRYATS